MMSKPKIEILEFHNGYRIGVVGFNGREDMTYFSLRPVLKYIGELQEEGYDDLLYLAHPEPKTPEPINQIDMKDNNNMRELYHFLRSKMNASPEQAERILDVIVQQLDKEIDGDIT